MSEQIVECLFEDDSQHEKKRSSYVTILEINYFFGRMDFYEELIFWFLNVTNYVISEHIYSVRILETMVCESINRIIS